MSLKEKAANGVKWTAISAVYSSITQISLLIVLSRLLDKSDFGLMAIASFVVGFSQMFMDMGISNALIHKNDINTKQLSSLYWLNFLVGTAIFLILYLSAPLIAIFYTEPKLTLIIRLIAISFLIQPFGLQYIALLQKELKFKALAIRDIISKSAALLIGVLLGFSNFGVLSLVLSNIVGVLVSTVLLVLIGLPTFRPILYFRLKEIKEFISFGLFQMGEKTMNYFNSQIDTLIIGKLLGVNVLGTYNVAKNLVMRPAEIINPIITRVSFPIMAQLRTDTGRLRSIYLRTLKLLASINFPIFLFMAFFAKPIVNILFGDKWMDAVVLLQILSMYSLFRSTINPIGSLQLAMGRADLGFYWNLLMLVLVPFSIFVGSLAGIQGVCYAFLCVQIVISFPVWKFLVNPLSHANIREYYLCFFTPMVVALLSMSLSFLGFALLPSLTPLLSILMCATLSLLSYYTLSLFLNKNFIADLKFFLLKRKKVE